MNEQETIVDIITEKRRLAKELRDIANSISWNRGEPESKAEDLEEDADRLDHARMRMEIEMANLRKGNAKLREAVKLAMSVLCRNKADAPYRAWCEYDNAIDKCEAALATEQKGESNEDN